MNFRESEVYLLSLGNEVETMKLGLDRIRRLLAELGDPQNDYLKVQVAGTNGKGSVCAFLRSICLEAGIKAGVFTSPHLISITERINIEGIDIGENDFARFATMVRRTSERLVARGEIDGVPTFFEQVTATALLAFADAKVALAILETGLGGRLDATTAARAEIAAITRIDYDHQQYLGETIEEIATEKAAIIRADTDVIVIGDQTPAVRAVINERLRETGGGNPTFTEGAPIVLDARRAHSLPLAFPPSILGLLGKHQEKNATVAVAIAGQLQNRFSISDEHVNAGIKNARHPGRLEYIDNFLIDGAHNVGGAKALADFLDEFERRPKTLIFGAMNDKAVCEMLSILLPRVDRLILTQTNNSRAVRPSELLEQIPNTFVRERIVLSESVKDAMSRAREISEPNDIILVTGSLYLVGEAKRILNN